MTLGRGRPGEVRLADWVLLVGEGADVGGVDRVGASIGWERRVRKAFGFIEADQSAAPAGFIEFASEGQ